MVVSPQRLTRWPSYVRDRHAAITYTTPRDAPLARDVQPLAPATTGTPTVEPYRDSVYEQPAEVSSGALTKPRASSDPEPKRGWRRHRAGAGSGGNAAYLRWPHPQQ
ncbi:hypothetical protein MINTM007_33860 [Mycobacterium intracellulare]|nr:hypothetical protein MINTM007_33860 [Mycobacterium intracellulare]